LRTDAEAAQTEVWLGSIPVCVELAASSLVASSAPRPLWVLVPRVAYVASFAGDVADHFRDSVAEVSTTLADAVWFAERDDDDASIPTTTREAVDPFARLPAGALFDSARRRDVPWRLVAHFSARRRLPAATPASSSSSPASSSPGPTAAARVDEDSCERRFFHALKQATHLEHGTARSVLSMPRVDQAALWRAVCAGDRAGYAARDVKGVVSGPLESPLRHVPLRVVVPPTSRTRGRVVAQLPHSAYDAAAGRKRTLGDCVEAVLRVLASRRAAQDGGEQDESGSAVAGGAAGTKRNWTLRVHGVDDVDPDLPLLEAWKALRHADHFLYVVVVVGGSD